MRYRYERGAFQMRYYLTSIIFAATNSFLGAQTTTDEPGMRAGVLSTASLASDSTKDQISWTSKNKIPPMEECDGVDLDRDHFSHLQVGGNYTYAHIKPSHNSCVMGSLGGVQALYEYQAPERIYGGLAFAWRDGSVERHHMHRSVLEFDVQERLGYTMRRLRDNYTLSFFTGFGYRHFGEKVRNYGNSVTFEYNEFYFPLGFLFNAVVNHKFSIGWNFQLMPQVYSTVKIVPLKGARWILSSEIPNFRTEIPFKIIISRRYHFSLLLQPFFEFWRDGHTTAKARSGVSLNVPGNTYLLGGIDLNLRYSF